MLEDVNSDYADCVSRLLDKASLRKKISAVRCAYEEVEDSEVVYVIIGAVALSVMVIGGVVESKGEENIKLFEIFGHF